MKVLQVSKFFPPVVGGIELAAYELAEGLARVVVQADVLCAGQQASTQVERMPSGYTVTRAAVWGTLLSTSMAPSMVGLLRRLAPDYDIIHIHMPNPMAALAVWLVRPQAAVVLHWHSDVVRQRISRRFYGPLQSWLLRRADAVIATSQRYVDGSAALGRVRSKVSVIPIGISDNTARVHAENVAVLKNRYPGKKIVFALGRMAYYKGFEVLVQAAAALPDDAVVLIGGDGECLPALQTQVGRLSLRQRVHLLGVMDDAVAAQHLAACDVFCLPSVARSEAYGLVMLEAMSYGRPVVATTIEGSGVPWVNEHGVTGLNAEPGDASALAEALTRLLADADLRREMGAAARRRFVDELAAERMTQRTVALYDGLVRH